MLRPNRAVWRAATTFVRRCSWVAAESCQARHPTARSLPRAPHVRRPPLPPIDGPRCHTAARQAGAPEGRAFPRRVRHGALDMSLSRLNHWLPRREAHPEVMERTADFHHNIPDSFLPETDPVFDDATALHTAVHMLDPGPRSGDRPLYAFRGGLRGAGASSTDSKIAINIERGF